MKKLCTTTALSLFLAAGCAAEDPATVAIQVRAATSAGATDLPSLTLSDGGDTAYALQSASLHLRDIELDLPDGLACADIADQLSGGAVCRESSDGRDKIAIAGPFDVDLVAGTSEPGLEAVGIPSGWYRRIDFRVEDNPDDVSFAALAAFRHDQDDLLLDLSLDFSEDIRVEAPDGVAIAPETDLIAEFVVDNWLDGVDIASCLADGGVRIDSARVIVDDSSTGGSCSDIENTIKDNMKSSGQLGRR